MQENGHVLTPRGQRDVLVRCTPGQAMSLVHEVPGVVYGQNGVLTTWDTVPLVCERIGKDVPSLPEVPLAELPGVAQYQELVAGLEEPPRTYQEEDAAWLANRPYAFLCNPMRCLDGDTEVFVNRAGRGFRMTLRELHRKFHGGETAGRRWDLTIPTQVACFDEERSIVSNHLVQTHLAGVKEGYEVVVGDRRLTASADHKFRTPDGYVALRDLKPGDLVLMRERAPAERQTGPRKNPYRVVSVKGHPNARVYDVERQNRPNERVWHVLKHRLVYEAEVLNGMSVKDFSARVRRGAHIGLVWLDPALHIHHKDEDPTNNAASNLEALTPAEHNRQHDSSHHVLFDAVPRPIESITPVGGVEMFDLTLESPLNNYVANGFVVHNSGKTLTTLLGAILAGHKRILVLCPAISRFVWGDEVYKWLGQESLILSGLSLSRALQYCGTCKLSGRLPDGSRCPSCKQRNGSTYGYHIHEVRTTEPPKVVDVNAGGILWRCRKHHEVTSPSNKPLRCPKCREELRDILQNVEVIVANYDILSGKGYANKRGRVEKRDDLPGWGQALSLLDFDLAIIDESHTLRAFDTTEKKRGKMMYDRVRDIVARVPNVWMVTGTPIFGMVRDLYGQLEVATHGLVGDGRMWTERYCAGHVGPYGWEATGRSNEEELQARLKPILVSRPRSEILEYMPPKLRRVVYIDNDKPVRRKSTGSAAGTVAKLIDAIAPLKHDVIIDNVLSEMNEGLKTYVLTFRPKHAERIAKLLQKKMNSRNWRQQMNKNKAEVFLGQTAKGVDPKRRRELAKAFCDHKGAGVFIATIRSMPGSVSLKGVATVHMADFDTSPSSMEQAEDRGYEPGVPGYSITHYVVKNSIDDDLAQVVLPKFETKDRMLKDENAQNVLEAFRSEEETCDEVMARHTAHLNTSADEGDDWM
jgi:hypothetical protein